MTRRELLYAAGAAACASLAPVRAQSKALSNFGGAPAGFPMHNRAGRDGAKPFDFVEHCHNLGFGVVETRLPRSEEHTSELQSHSDLVCRLLLEKKKTAEPRMVRTVYNVAADR